MLGGPISKKGRQDRERHLDLGIADPAPQSQHQPTDTDPPSNLAGKNDPENPTASLSENTPALTAATAKR